MSSIGRGLVRKVSGGSFGLGVLATATFYAIVHLPGFAGGTLARYTTGHITEFATVALFFWGVADLLLKYLAFGKERRALRHDWLPAAADPAPASDATGLYKRIAGVSKHLSDSYVARRLERGLYYVREKRSASGLEEHLRYLAELDGDRSHAAYSLVRFIAWIIPILGFLGTVVHFTMAIANVTPEQLEHSLSAVTDGLAIAFDTTALALSLSMVVMFVIYLVERIEQNLLHEVELRAYSELGHRFVIDDQSTTPFASAVRAAGEATVQQVGRLVERQVELWANSIAAMQLQYEQASRKQLELTASTISGLQQQYVTSSREQDERLGRVVAALQTERKEQTAALQTTAGQVAALQGAMSGMTEQLAAVLADKGQLAGLQQQLNDNLRLLQQTQRMDEAVNMLTAAVHLLTVRQQPYVPAARAA